MTHLDLRLMDDVAPPARGKARLPAGVELVAAGAFAMALWFGACLAAQPMLAHWAS